jgi:hypothetical protein
LSGGGFRRVLVGEPLRFGDASPHAKGPVGYGKFFRCNVVAALDHKARQLPISASSAERAAECRFLRTVLSSEGSGRLAGRRTQSYIVTPSFIFDP